MNELLRVDSNRKINILLLLIFILCLVVGCDFFFLHYSQRKPNTNFLSVPIMPENYQVFPAERYPGLKCYVIASSMRHFVISDNCHTIYVDKENITVENIVVPRQTPNKRCNRCTVSDYLNILSLVLFGCPERGIPPLAPMGALVLEDDVIICNKALEVLDKCFEGQYNCLLGWGAWANFYAGASSKQPDPEKYKTKRYVSRDDLFSHKSLSREPYIDYFIRHSNRHVVQTDYISHVGSSYSVINHTSPGGMKCSIENSIAKKAVALRFRDIDIFNGGKEDVAI